MRYASSWENCPVITPGPVMALLIVANSMTFRSSVTVRIEPTYARVAGPYSLKT